MRVDGDRDIVERTFPAFVDPGHPSERQSRGNAGHFTPPPKPSMGLHGKLEQAAHEQPPTSDADPGNATSLGLSSPAGSQHSRTVAARSAPSTTGSPRSS